MTMTDFIEGRLRQCAGVCQWLCVAGLAWGGVAQAAPPCVAEITSATYTQPTERYAHGVLGDDIEYGAISVQLQDPAHCGGATRAQEVALPRSMVFEDLQPRLVDVSGDGMPEVVTVESSVMDGARLAVWGVGQAGFDRLAATPYIGTAYRWLAPIGAADFDGDGAIDIAYVDRPHLARLLKVWRYRDGALEQIAQRAGLTNHRIGQDFISGGVRDCGQGPEMITASGDWSSVVATQLKGGDLVSRDLGKHRGAESFAAALACQALR